MTNGRSICGHTFKMMPSMMMIIRDVGDRHYSEVQRHPGGRVSTKVIHALAFGVECAIVDETRNLRYLNDMVFASRDRNPDCQGGHRGKEAAPSPPPSTSTSTSTS